MLYICKKVFCKKKKKCPIAHERQFVFGFLFLFFFFSFLFFCFLLDIMYTVISSKEIKKLMSCLFQPKCLEEREVVYMANKHDDFD